MRSDPSTRNSAPNFRDVSDLVPALRKRVLFRSDLVFEPDEQEASILRASGIRLVVDLRSPSERSTRPNAWFRGQGTEIVDFDVTARGDPAKMVEAWQSADGIDGAHAMMVEIYRLFPTGALPVLKALGPRLANGDLPVLIHCAAGKDRTGFSIAAILMAIGIEAGEIEADYMASEGRVHARTLDNTRRSMRRSVGEDINENALATISGVHRDYLHSAFNAVNAEFGSFDNYLNAAGIDAAMRDALAAHLLA